MTSAATDAPRATPRSIPVRDPRTGLYDAAILAPTASALNNIAERARRAQPAWAGLGFEGRIAVLRRFTQA
jgi:succinate-semialdehyde dehydrogenase/glutarate-semialdehyde dehydrogenase